MSAEFTHLLSPLRVGPKTVRNRVLVTAHVPQLAENGVPGDHYVAYHRARAKGGVGLQLTGATPVHASSALASGNAIANIDDRVIPGYARLAEAVHAEGGCMLAQLAHYGATLEGGDAGQPIWGPSPTASEIVRQVPHVMTAAEIGEVVRAFAAAAGRVRAGGLDGIEILAAFGLLLASFLSPYSNKRTDRYGGSLENRLRFPLEVFDAVRQAVPASVPVWVRVSATDWVEGGWDLPSTIAFGQALKARGCAAIHVSSGGASPKQKIALGPGYQVPFAEALKEAVGLPTIAVGLITEAAQAEAVLAEGRADAVALARAMLYDPRWPWHAAAKLGASVKVPPQYWRSQPRELKDLFAGQVFGAR